jgi:hypothetical protein
LNSCRQVKMLNLTAIFKLFKKDDNISAFFQPNMNGPAADAMPHFTESLVRFIHTHAIGFYRAVGSHDFGGYPGVWEEFFFLILFVTEYRLKEIISADCDNRVIMSLRSNLNEFLLKHDANFESQLFWDRYEYRYELYKSRLQPGDIHPCFDDIVSAFSSNIILRLDEWPALVSHHSSNAAAAAIVELRGYGF